MREGGWVMGAYPICGSCNVALGGGQFRAPSSYFGSHTTCAACGAPTSDPPHVCTRECILDRMQWLDDSRIAIVLDILDRWINAENSGEPSNQTCLCMQGVIRARIREAGL